MGDEAERLYGFDYGALACEDFPSFVSADDVLNGNFARMNGFVIICESFKHNGQHMFLANKNCDWKWTRDLDFARIFKTKNQAESVRKIFKYNKPIVCNLRR